MSLTPNRNNPLVGLLTTTALEGIQQLAGSAGGGDAALVSRLIESSAAYARNRASMSNTVTLRGSTEYTQRNSQKGKPRTRKYEIERALASNLVNVYWQWKGLGRPYNFGFFNMSKFQFLDTEIYVACPLYLMDLTSTNNVNSTGTNYKCPMYRMYKNRTDGSVIWRPTYSQGANGSFCPTTDFTKSAGSWSTTENNTSPWKCLNAEALAINANSILPWARDYISSIDIYLNLFAARNYPSRFKVDVISLPDWCCPYNNNDVQTATPEDVTCADKQLHDAYWTNELVTWTVHPLDVQRGAVTGGQPALMYSTGPFGMYRSSPRSHIGGPKFFNFDPKDTSISEPNANTGARMHREKITLYPNREVDLNYRQQTFYNTANADALKPVTDPSDGNADSLVRLGDQYTMSPKPEQRMYLLVQATDFVESGVSTATVPDTTSNTPYGGSGVATFSKWGSRIATDGNGNPGTMATNDLKYAPSFDLNVIKLCRRLN